MQPRKGGGNIIYTYWLYIFQHKISKNLWRIKTYYCVCGITVTKEIMVFQQKSLDPQAAQ